MVSDNGMLFSTDEEEVEILQSSSENSTQTDASINDIDVGVNILAESLESFRKGTRDLTKEYEDLAFSFYGLKVRKGEVGILSGKGGSGKSSFACHLVSQLLKRTSSDTKEEAYNNSDKGDMIRNCEVKKILFVSAEEKTDLIYRRFARFGITEEDNLTILGRDFFDSVTAPYACVDITAGKGNLGGGYTSKMFRLLEKIQLKDVYDLVIIDSLIATAPHDLEYKSYTSSIFFSSVVEQIPGASIMFLHHAGKGEESKARGSSAISAACRWQLFLKKVEPKDVKKPSRGLTTLETIAEDGLWQAGWRDKGIASPFFVELAKNNDGGDIPKDLVFAFNDDKIIQASFDSLQREEKALDKKVKTAKVIVANE